MGLTFAQQQAIAARGNVLVTAGAGTGKTRTLVERCLHCLLHEKPEVSLEQILMVTFTEAAATEMRQRIRDRLEEQLRQTPGNLRWHEQLALFDRAHIGTLHSFCLQLVRAHFYELELDPQLAVLGEEEAHLLADETLTAVLDNHYSGRAPGAEAVQKLIQMHGGSSDQLIRALVLRLHHYIQSLADPAAWFHTQKAMFDAPTPEQWQRWLFEGFGEWRAEWLIRLRENANPDLLLCAKTLDTFQVSPFRQDMVAALQNFIANVTKFKSKSGVGRSKRFKDFHAGAEFLLSLAMADGAKDPLV